MLSRRIDPELGIVYAARGNRPIRKRRRGYIQVEIDSGWTSAHRLIWEAVNGPIPDGMQINHINGLKDDNRITNLELVTPSQNTAHAYQAGLNSAAGTRNGRARLTEDEVCAIRERVSAGERYSAIARELDLPPSTVRNAAVGVSWPHLPGVA